MADKIPEVKATILSTRIKKAAKDLIKSNSLNNEDAFEGEYFSETLQVANAVIRPPYDPLVLSRAVVSNNTLGKCISAMETNIDGTGYVFERSDGQTLTSEDEINISKLKDFFSEVYPGKSFIGLRRELRRDLESIGYGFLEVIRALDGSLIFINNVSALTTRLVVLDEPIAVKRRVKRNGTVQESQWLWQSAALFRH